jgi:hypothetical protein
VHEGLHLEDLVRGDRRGGRDGWAGRVARDRGP